MFQNKILRCLSLLLVTSLLFGAIPTMAEETSATVYNQIDISSAATGKFWVDPNVRNELLGSHYSGKGWTENGYKGDFVAANGGVAYSVKAARYPMRIDANTSDSIPDMATISGNNILSNKSGVSYLLPRKTATAAEKEVISLGTNTTLSQTLAVQTKADKIHFLVAAAFGRDMKFSVTPIYKDGENYVQEKEIFTVVGGNTAEDEDEICLIEARETVNHTTNDFAGNANDGIFGGKLVIHEFCLDIDYPDAELSAILFNADETTVIVNNTHRIGSLAVVSVTTLKDWTEKIEAAEALISAAVESPDDVDKVISAVNAVSEIKDAGLDADNLISNISLFNNLFGEGASFADTIIESVYANADITWDNTEDYLEKTLNIINAINEMGISYNELSSDSRLVIEGAYANMTDLLIESDAEEEAILTRFELLKNTGIDALESIFRQKVIWTENVTVAATPELISFEFDFSQSVDTAMLTSDYISVTANNKELPTKLVSFDAKSVDGATCGVTVNIINTFDYDNPYKVEISKSLIGENGGQWTYASSVEKDISPCIEVNKNGVSISGESISGKLGIINNQHTAQNFVLMLGAYSEDGLLLGYKLISGSVAAETTSQSDMVEFDIPSGTTEILCYPMESYSSMNILCKPIKLK